MYKTIPQMFADIVIAILAYAVQMSKDATCFQVGVLFRTVQ